MILHAALFSDAEAEKGQGAQALQESSAPNLVPLRYVELSKDSVG